MSDKVPLPVIVKPLEWDDTSKYRSTTQTLIGVFWAEQDLEGPLWTAKAIAFRGWESPGHKSSEEAKAAVQAHYDAIILSVLSPAIPATGSGEVGWPPLVEIGRVLGFFASVIKSGEPWTAACQAEYNKANLALQAIYASPTNPAEAQAVEVGK